MVDVSFNRPLIVVALPGMVSQVFLDLPLVLPETIWELLKNSASPQLTIEDTYQTMMNQTAFQWFLSTFPPTSSQGLSWFETITIPLGPNNENILPTNGSPTIFLQNPSPCRDPTLGHFANPQKNGSHNSTSNFAPFSWSWSSSRNRWDSTVSLAVEKSR